MEENQAMTNEQLESNLKSLRVKATITKILTGCAGAATIIMWFFMENIAMGLVFLVVAFVFASLSSNCSDRLKKLLSDNIIGGVLKEALGDTVEYNPWGKINPGSMAFPFSYNCVYGSDRIKAVYHGLNIELGDIELMEESEVFDEEGHTDTSKNTVFKGQWLICDFILTPHMMEYILTMADKSGGTVYLSFLREGKLHVAVRTGRDFFELGKSNTNEEALRQKFLGELSWFTDMVDTLRVEDTLYKKETNV